MRYNDYEVNYTPYSDIYNRIASDNGSYIKVPSQKQNAMNSITNVIFNNPATIVFWSDGTKTVVKCDERDEFYPE